MATPGKPGRAPVKTKERVTVPSYSVAHLRSVIIGPGIVEHLERIDATLEPFGGGHGRARSQGGAGFTVRQFASGRLPRSRLARNLAPATQCTHSVGLDNAFMR